MNDNWMMRWFEVCDVVAGWSKDRSRQVGAVIVDDRQTLVSMGWNGFPRGVNDNPDERHDRPAKYLWTEHAERNAIYNAASNGVKTSGCTMYIKWYPCADCARAIIQSGIKKLVCTEPDWDDDTYCEDFKVTRTMFEECDSIEVEMVSNVGEKKKRK